LLYLKFAVNSKYGSKITDNYTIIYGVSENTLNVEFVVTILL